MYNSNQKAFTSECGNSFRYKCETTKSPSCYSNGLPLKKYHVVPLCLFLQQLASLFPDRTAVLNSSWHLLSPVPKIKNNFTD